MVLKTGSSLGGIDIQPSEFVKIIYVFFIAGALSKFRDFKHIVVISAIAAVHVLILVAEKGSGCSPDLFYHLSCYAVFGYDAGGISGGRIGSRGGGCGGCLQTFLACADPCDCLERAMAAINNEGYQICRSLFAIGTGGLFGMGLGQGLPGECTGSRK